MTRARRLLAVAAAALTAGSLATIVPSAQASPAPSGYVDTWTASADHLGGPYTDKTVRDIVHTSLGGSAARVRLSNAFGTGPVRFDAVYVGVQATGANVVAGSNRQVTFGGSRAVTVPRGAEVLSDPVPMTVRPESNLAVSIHVDGDTGEVTGHSLGVQDNYYSDGNTASATSGASYVYPSGSWFWLDAVQVQPAKQSGTVVALGDSITDGYQSTVNANHRWPNYLATRLAKSGRTGIADEGISGNKVTADGAGVSAQARLDRDVISQPRVRSVIFLEGINDIGGGDVTSPAQLIAADRQIIARLHASGVRVLGGTITPFQGAGYYSSKGERIREAVNEWIRTSGEFDGVVDFDAATRDPNHPHRFLPLYDSGDHLHPDDAGYQAMADAVPLALLG